MESVRIATAASLLTLAATVGIIIYWTVYKKPQSKKKMVPRLQNLEEAKNMKWESVGRVAKLYIYPVKSCKATVVQSASAEWYGLVKNGVRDRSFMIRSEKGSMITGRMIPSTVLIKPTLENNTLTLTFPDTEELQVDIAQVEKNNERLKAAVWEREVFGLNCGEDTSVWLQKVLRRKCKLLYHAHPTPGEPKGHPERHKYPMMRDDDQALYADGFAFMLMSTESIADLQSRVSCQIAPEEFRPNILVEGLKKPYDEDEWEYVKIGHAVFRNVKPCSRCIFTTVNTNTGKKEPNMEPLRTLKRYRRADANADTFFGINLGLDLCGTICEGDEVFVTRSKNPLKF